MSSRIFASLTCVFITAAAYADSKPRLDLYGDPLPAGALARLGSSRFRISGWSRIRSIVFGPKDDTLLVCLSDHAVVYDRKTGQRIRSFTILANGEPACSFSRDGRYLVIVDEGPQIFRIIDTASGQEVAKTVVPDAQALPAVFSDDGSKLVVTTKEHAALFEWATKKKVRAFGPVKQISNLGLSPDGKWLVIASAHGPLQLWDISSNKLVRQIQPPQPIVGIPQICFSPDSLFVALGGWSETRLVEVNSGKVAAIVKNGEPTHSLAFDREGKNLISGFQTSIGIWDVASNKTRSLSVHGSWSPTLAVSHDGNTVAITGTWCEYKRIRLWDLGSGEELFPDSGHRSEIEFASFLPGEEVLISTEISRLALWDTHTGRLKRDINYGGRFGWSAAFSSDRKLAAVVQGRAKERWVEVRDWNTNTVSKKLICSGDKRIRRMGFSPDAKFLLTAHNRMNEPPGDESELQKWDLTTGKVVQKIHTATTGLFIDLQITPDGEFAVGATAQAMNYVFLNYGAKSPIIIYDLRRGCELMSLDQGTAVSSMDVSPDGRWLAYNADHKIQLLELATGKRIFTLGTAERFGAPVAISPDGRLLVTARGSLPAVPYRLEFWDLANGKKIHTLDGLPAHATRLAFAPDGKRLASCLEDATILIWEVAAVYWHVHRPRKELQPADWPRLWQELSDLDAHRAHQAIWTLADAGDQTVGLLKQKLQPAKADPAVVKRLIADLDSVQFPVREAATRELEKLGDLAEAHLQRELKKSLSLEARRRVERILSRCQKGFQHPDLLRQCRSIQVLEYIGTAKARQVLQSLASGDPQARQTRAAIHAIRRLEANAKRSIDPGSW
jgi:WD40 repeat protein